MNPLPCDDDGAGLPPDCPRCGASRAWVILPRGWRPACWACDGTPGLTLLQSVQEQEDLRALLRGVAIAALGMAVGFAIVRLWGGSA